MQAHLNQAQHNEHFHDCIQTQFPDKFYDWRTTALFYIALHYLKALAAHKGIDIGVTHEEMAVNINPDKPKSSMPVKKHVYRSYKNLRDYSNHARYDGFCEALLDFENDRKNDYEFALQDLDDFKKYISAQGISL
jgi:HEPN domain